MEIEENRGLIDKKDFEDQLARIQLKIFAHTYGSLSLSCLDTQSCLGAHWHWSKKGKESKKKEGASKEDHDQATTIGFFAGVGYQNRPSFYPFLLPFLTFLYSFIYAVMLNLQGKYP